VPLTVPSLKHENIPEQELPIALASLMLIPALPYQSRIKYAIFPQPLFAKQILGPFT
jgi:hypothetical protein